METEYTSSELAEIGNSAESDTIPELLVSIYHRQITEIQVDAKEKSDKITSAETMELYFEVHGDVENVEQIYDQEVIAALLRVENMKTQCMEGVRKLLDYREENYEEYLHEQEEGVL